VGGMDWIFLAHDSDEWRVPLNMEVIIQVL
jgi:hypothetical protein